MQRMRVIMVLFGDKFDFDEGAEVGGGDGLTELHDVGSTATELLEDGNGVSEDGDPKGLPVVYLKDRGDTVFHRWT